MTRMFSARDVNEQFLADKKSPCLATAARDERKRSIYATAN